MHRVSGESLAEALAGLGLASGVDVQKLWEASDLIDEHIGDEPVTPLAPRVAVRAAEHDLPAGLVAALDANLRGQAAGDRLDEVLTEVVRVRAEVGSPPLAAPLGQILGSQALLNVLSASRYSIVVDEMRALFEKQWGTPPGPIDEDIRRAVARTADPDSDEFHLPALDELRAQAEGLASSEEELLLLGLFGEEAERLLKAIRGRATGVENLETAFERARAERIREVVRIVQETGVGEITIEEDGMRVSVRRTAEPAGRPPPSSHSRLRLLDRELGQRLPYSTCWLSQSSSGSRTNCTTSRTASRHVSRSLIWPWNCGSSMGREHEVERREHVLGQQLHALGQQPVMVDEGLDRVEQAVAQAGFVGAAGAGGNQVDVALAHRRPSSVKATPTPRPRPRRSCRRSSACRDSFSPSKSGMTGSARRASSRR